MTGIVDEIIVVDSSTDATPKIAESFGAKVVFEPRKGYGRALQSDMEKASGDIIVYIDGDYTCDVVLGNRLNNKIQNGAMNLLNRFGNTLISLIFSLFFFRGIDDTQCGLRAIRKWFLEDLAYRNYGMPDVTEQLIKLIRKGAKIVNIPIVYRPRIGTTKLCGWTDGFKILSVIFRECFSPGVANN